MIKNNNTKNIAILALLMLLASVGAFFLIIYMLITERAVVAKAALSVAEEMERGGQKSAEMALVEELHDDRDTLASYFVTDEEVVDVLQKIEAIGERTGAKVVVTSVTEEVVKKVVKKATDNEDGESVEKEDKKDPGEAHIRLGISAEGEWSEVYWFFTLLELMPIAETTERVSMEKAEERVAASDEYVAPWRGLFEVRIKKEL